MIHIVNLYVCPRMIHINLLRVSQIDFLAKALLRNTSLVELKLEHNQIEQAGGEVLQPAVKRLECFTISHKFMTVGHLFNACVCFYLCVCVCVFVCVTWIIITWVV